MQLGPMFEPDSVNGLPTIGPTTPRSRLRQAKGLCKTYCAITKLSKPFWRPWTVASGVASTKLTSLHTCMKACQLLFVTPKTIAAAGKCTEHKTQLLSSTFGTTIAITIYYFRGSQTTFRRVWRYEVKCNLNMPPNPLPLPDPTAARMPSQTSKHPSIQTSVGQPSKHAAPSPSPPQSPSSPAASPTHMGRLPRLAARLM